MGVYDTRGFPQSRPVQLTFGADDNRIIDPVDADAGTRTVHMDRHREPDRATLPNGVLAGAAYANAQYPTPVLAGRSARERAEITMWHVRIETGLTGAAAAYRSRAGADAERTTRDHDRTPRQKSLDQVLHTMHLLDRQLADRRYIIGERYSIADINALAAVNFAHSSGIAIPETEINLKAWHARVSVRPGARS